MSAVRILTCQQCGKEWSRPAQRGQLPKRCPECKAGPKSAVRLEARAVPTMEGGVAVVSGPSMVAEAPGTCWNCDKPTHQRADCPYADEKFVGCCCCIDDGGAS